MSEEMVRRENVVNEVLNRFNDLMASQNKILTACIQFSNFETWMKREKPEKKRNTACHVLKTTNIVWPQLSMSSNRMEC